MNTSQELLLVQMAGAPGCVRLWVGIANQRKKPAAPVFQIDGQTPVASGVRTIVPWEMTRSTFKPGQKPGVCSGVWELDLPAGEGEIGVRVAGVQAKRRLRALTGRLPESGEQFNVLMCSCFDYNTTAGMIQRTVQRELRDVRRPDLILWMGDQVYLDQPLNMAFKQDKAWLESRFEATYQTNWFTDPGLRAILEAGPGIFAPDDHEYWNNFPTPTVVAPSTCRADMRSLWGDAARRMFGRFQLGAGTSAEPVVGGPTVIDLEPASLIVVDTRSNRLDDCNTLFSAQCASRLTSWAERIANDPNMQTGLIVLGASMLDEPAGRIAGRVADYTLPNYAAGFSHLLSLLEALERAGKRFVLITGDVHWGRVARLHSRTHGRTVGYEVIASPLSLVGNPLDSVKHAGATMREIFSERERWPLHKDPPKPPHQIPTPETARNLNLPARYRTSQNADECQRGDHIAMLTLSRFGSGVQAQVRAIPIQSDSERIPGYALHHPLDLRPVH